MDEVVALVGEVELICWNGGVCGIGDRLREWPQLRCQLVIPWRHPPRDAIRRNVISQLQTKRNILQDTDEVVGADRRVDNPKGLD